MGTLLCSCAGVREPIELSLGVVSGVGQGMGVLDEGPRAPRRKEGFLAVGVSFPLV